MKQELQEQIFERFPAFFSQRHLSPQQTCMCWGIETGDGWYELIWNMCETLDFCGSKLQFTQVKEKFGTLRCYEVGATEKDLGTINFFAKQSSETCEACGKSGEVYIRGTSWLLTSCEECAAPFANMRRFNHV